MTRATMQMAQGYLGRIKELEKENEELKEERDFYNKERGIYKAMYLKEILKKNKAIKIIKNLLPVTKFYNKHRDKSAIMDITPIYDAEQFLEKVK